MDYSCRFDSLGNSSTATGSSELRGDGKPELHLGRRDFVFFVPAVLPSRFSFLILFLCVFAVPMRKCSGELPCMCSTFLIAIQNVPSTFHRGEMDLVVSEA